MFIEEKCPATATRFPELSSPVRTRTLSFAIFKTVNAYALLRSLVEKRYFLIGFLAAFERFVKCLQSRLKTFRFRDVDLLGLYILHSESHFIHVRNATRDNSQSATL